MLSWLTIFTLNIFVLLTIINADTPCKFISDKGVIDLASLANTDGTAAYKDIMQTGSNYKYSYNPCKPFSEGNQTCVDAAICQLSMDEGNIYVLGKHDSARWSLDTSLFGIATISYQDGDRTARISLRCGNDIKGQLEALGEDPVETYNFRLTSKCACWDGCYNPPPTTTPPRGASAKLGGCGSGILFLITLLFL